MAVCVKPVALHVVYLFWLAWKQVVPMLLTVKGKPIIMLLCSNLPRNSVERMVRSSVPNCWGCVRENRKRPFLKSVQMCII